MREKEIELNLLPYGHKRGEVFILVKIAEQRLYVIKKGKILKQYKVSTSKFGPGQKKDSFKTPLGVHRIFKKIGDGVPLGGVFVGRKFTGIISKIPSDEDLITSRILWLEGLQDGKNKGGDVDTKERFIYVHGTPAENLLGTAASKGCIRMGNKDIIELYSIVKEGTLVLIEV